MSQTVPPPSTPPDPTPIPPAVNVDSLRSPQFIIAIAFIAIVAGVLASVTYRGDAAQINLVLGFVFGVGTTVGGFYFGSSRSSQSKDATIAAQVTPAAPTPGTTTTTTVATP